tara:strand:- start:496 stop:681 length:186 start_codon:yes stop_codon:yes gene_type:complete
MGCVLIKFKKKKINLTENLTIEPHKSFCYNNNLDNNTKFDEDNIYTSNNETIIYNEDNSYY